VSNLGKWDWHYVDLTKPYSYGNDATYQAAAEWTADCNMVEDWGCGGGWLRNFIEPERYRGIDGSKTKFADEVKDLVEYHSDVEGIVLRGVLEHNHKWQRILQNAIDSYTKKLFIAIFTPMSKETHILQLEERYANVPTYSFRLEDLTDMLPNCSVEWVESDTAFLEETLIRVK